MDPLDPILLRWLSRVDDDSPLQLGRLVVDSELEAGQDQAGQTDEAQAELIHRLRLVEGLLATLDHRTAPPELTGRVQAEIERFESESRVDRDAIPEVPDEWLEDLANTEPELTSQCDWGTDDLGEQALPGGGLEQKAPEFLDRIVEQRLAAIFMERRDEMALAQDLRDGNAPDAQSTRGRMGFRGGAKSWKVLSLALSCLLVLVFVPWKALLADRGDAHSPFTSIEIVEYSDLESLRLAHPDQVRVANRFGVLGMLGESSVGKNGPAWAPSTDPSSKRNPESSNRNPERGND